MGWICLTLKRLPVNSAIIVIILRWIVYMGGQMDILLFIARLF